MPTLDPAVLIHFAWTILSYVRECIFWLFVALAAGQALGATACLYLGKIGNARVGFAIALATSSLACAGVAYILKP